MKNGLTFESFTVTSNNRRAYDMAIRFAECSYHQPLCIFGETGTGKTHLLYAVKNYIEQNQPDVNVVLTNATEFAEEMVSTIKRSSSLISFRDKYRNVDVLLIDDIQCLAGKPKTQEELILIFNKLYESGKRIMMTSSGLNDDNSIDVRLQSRCFFGKYAFL